MVLTRGAGKKGLDERGLLLRHGINAIGRNLGCQPRQQGQVRKDLLMAGIEGVEADGGGAGNRAHSISKIIENRPGPHLQPIPPW